MNHNVKDYLILKADFDFTIPRILLPQANQINLGVITDGVDIWNNLQYCPVLKPLHTGAWRGIYTLMICNKVEHNKIWKSITIHESYQQIGSANLTQQGWIGCANWLVTLEDGDGFSNSFVSCFSFPLHFQISSCSTLLQFLNLRVAGDSPAQLPKSVYCLKNFIQKRTEGLNSS